MFGTLNVKLIFLLLQKRLQSNTSCKVTQVLRVTQKLRGRTRSNFVRIFEAIINRFLLKHSHVTNYVYIFLNESQVCVFVI